MHFYATAMKKNAWLRHAALRTSRQRASVTRLSRVLADIDVAMIARMVAGKGHRLLRNALIELARTMRSGLVVHVCGFGPLEPEIRQEFQALKRHQVKLYFERDPFRVLLRTKIYVSLQDTENYPSQSLLEAMACSCAVVATGCGLDEKPAG